MSTPPLQRRSCVDKIRYRTQKSAWETIKTMRKDGLDAPRKLRAYRCRYYTGWHIGHPGE